MIFRWLKILGLAIVAATASIIITSSWAWALITSGALTLQSGTGTDIIFQTNGASTRGKIKSTGGSFVLTNASLATNATDGFTYIPKTTGGVPSGAATGLQGNPVVIDSNTGALWEYVGGSTWYPVGSPILKFSGRALGAATDYLGDAGTAVTTIVLTTAPAYPSPPCKSWGTFQVNPVLNTFSNAATVQVLVNGAGSGVTVSVPAGSATIVTDVTYTFSTNLSDTLDVQITSAIGTTGVLVLSATMQCL